MDRRALFFAGAAVVCGVLAVPIDAELRWVPLALAGLYLVLAIASYLDFRSQQRGISRTGQ